MQHTPIPTWAALAIVPLVVLLLTALRALDMQPLPKRADYPPPPPPIAMPVTPPAAPAAAVPPTSTPEAGLRPVAPQWDRMRHEEPAEEEVPVPTPKPKPAAKAAPKPQPQPKPKTKAEVEFPGRR